MDFTVGGRKLTLTKEEVERAVRGQVAESYQTYYVDLADGRYPTKQVLALATGWPRDSFTSHEANRVLGRLGFTCVNADTEGHKSFTPTAAAAAPDHSQGDEIQRLTASIEVLQAAVAGLAARVTALEVKQP